jgi:hypothetical protein
MFEQSISFSANAILEWITKADYRPQQNHYISRRQAGTGLWLLETKEFRTWADGYAQTLLCPGFPRAGKPNLTSIVVDHLLSRFKDTQVVGIAYIYCNFQRQEEQDTRSLLAALLRRLIQGHPNLIKVMGNLFDKYGSGKTSSLSLGEIS